MTTVVAIFGPTASGKSAVAVELAERVGGEIVSCDAMQAYRGLPVLTNQPAAGELARVPHHLVGVWSLEHAGSVAEFGELARAAVDDVIDRGRVPIVAGGTGLYLRAALSDLVLPPEVPASVRLRYGELYDREGARAAHAALAERDPGAAVRVHPNDRRRVVRALELAEAGHSLAARHDDLWSADTRHPTAVFGLDVPADVVRSRIAVRTRLMFERGVGDEVRDARRRHRFSHTAERIHGLQDVTGLLNGELRLDQAIERLDARTRRYAKRQRTWMRRIPGLAPVDADRPPEDVAADIAARV